MFSLLHPQVSVIHLFCFPLLHTVKLPSLSPEHEALISLKVAQEGYLRPFNEINIDEKASAFLRLTPVFRELPI